VGGKQVNLHAVCTGDAEGGRFETPCSQDASGSSLLGFLRCRHALPPHNVPATTLSNAGMQFTTHLFLFIVQFAILPLLNRDEIAADDAVYAEDPDDSGEDRSSNLHMTQHDENANSAMVPSPRSLRRWTAVMLVMTVGAGLRCLWLGGF